MQKLTNVELPKVPNELLDSFNESDRFRVYIKRTFTLNQLSIHILVHM